VVCTKKGDKYNQILMSLDLQNFLAPRQKFQLTLTIIYCEHFQLTTIKDPCQNHIKIIPSFPDPSHHFQTNKVGE